MTASAASAYPPTAACPHSRCRGSVLNSATPPANRAEATSPALSQAQGMVVTDCQTPGSVAPVPPSTPVVGASSRLSRISTGHIVRSISLPHVTRAADWASSARMTHPVAATSRTGMATARAFAAEGARVCLVGLVEEELRAGAWRARRRGHLDAGRRDQLDAGQGRGGADGRDVRPAGRGGEQRGISGVIAPVADYPEEVFDQVL